MDLVELITTLWAAAPNARFTASISTGSPAGVPRRVRVDVAHTIGWEPRVFQSTTNGAFLTLHRWLGEPVCVARSAESDDLRYGLGPPGRGSLLALQNEGGRALSQDQASTFGVERTTRPFCTVRVLLGNYADGLPCGDGPVVEHSLRPPGDDHIRVTVSDRPEGFSDSDGRRGARDRIRVRRPANPEAHADLRGRTAGHDHGDGRRPAPPAVPPEVGSVGPLKDFGPSEPTPHVDSRFLGPVSVDQQTGVLQGVSGGYHGHLSRTRHEMPVPLADPLTRFEVDGGEQHVRAQLGGA